MDRNPVVTLVDVDDGDLLLGGICIFVDAHHDLFARIDLLLETVGGIGNFHLRESLVDRRDHTAHLVDLLDIRHRLLLHGYGDDQGEDHR